MRATSPSAIKSRFGIEGAQEILLHVEFLGQRLARAGVGQRRQVRHVVELGRNGADEGPLGVVRRDLVVDEGGLRGGLGELARRGVVELAGGAQSVGALEGRERLAEIAPVASIDRAGREARPIEQDLGLEDLRVQSLGEPALQQLRRRSGRGLRRLAAGTVCQQGRRHDGEKRDDDPMHDDPRV
jgi:hypothetical protein